jgi:hypothetical protein
MHDAAPIHNVIPAQAGIQYQGRQVPKALRIPPRIPAFAGMTTGI